MQQKKVQPLHYILEGHTPVVEPDLLTWARWLESADRRVALTEHEFFRVSTVFLGLDHQFGRGPPLLFETMVFMKTGNPAATNILERADEDIRQQRYANWEDAELGHQAMVNRMIELARKAAKVTP